MAYVARLDGGPYDGLVFSVGEPQETIELTMPTPPAERVAMSCRPRAATAHYRLERIGLPRDTAMDPVSLCYVHDTARRRDEVPES